MAQRVTCDGCGLPELANETFAHVGFVRPVDYCPECKAKYDEFAKQRDALHTRLAQEWATEVEKLEQTLRATLEEGRIPDE